MLPRLLTACCLALLCASCPLSGAYCPHGACEPNGRCEDVEGEAVCICDEAYEPGPELVCAPVTDRLMGESCAEDANCRSLTCYKEGSRELGYCSIYDCESSMECVDRAPVEDTDMCCIRPEDAFHSVCVRMLEGHCEYGPDLCGHPCGDDPQVCPASAPCMKLYEDRMDFGCAPPCHDDSSCADCPDSLEPGLDFRCVELQSGDKRCLPTN